ncbi:MAG: ABC-F family ATP-binding cassette domain-containing protein [Bdellovibrionota bacterium]
MSQNLLQLNGGNKAFGMQVLFDQATFALNEGEHVGVIGPNGAGKTTLFKILIGEEDLDEGQIVKSRSLSLGYLSQHDHWHADETGNSYLERISKLPLWQVKTMGRELKVTEDIFEKKIMSLSGGYRMRIKLLGLLGQDPNLLLLDEPTNYLDLETTLLLEVFLQSYEGAFLLISHDREFLRRTTDHILEVEAGEIVKYNGNIDDYFDQKELLRTQLEAKARSQADKRKVVLDFVARFGASANKAKQAQSRLKSLDRMENIAIKDLPVGASIQIPEPPHVGKSIIKLEKASFGYSEKKVISDISLEIKRGDHVAVVGLNGAGKSTLLKGIVGTLKPLDGTRELGYEVKIGIFNQHVIEVLNPNHTVMESLEDAAHNDVKRQEVLNMAGSLLFSGDRIHKKVQMLSGGEKSRVALGRLLLEKVPCLLLDEPTNHLDFQTVEALTQALIKYTGTFVVVSHDRGFIKRVGNKILEVSSGGVLLYPGTYDEYVWSLQKRLATEEDVVEKVAVKIVETKKTTDKRERDKKLRTLSRKIEQCEETIAKLEKQNSEINEKIVAGDASRELGQEMANNFIKIQELESEWLNMEEEKKSLTEDL